MSNEISTVYFLAQGRALESILAYNTAKNTALDAITVLFNEIGAKQAAGSGATMAFILDDTHETPGISGMRRKPKSQCWWVADSKTSEGKLLIKRLKAITMPSHWDIKVGVGPVIGDGMRLHSPKPELVGDTWILACPHLKGTTLPAPFDSQMILASEYWRMKEALEPPVPVTPVEEEG